MAKGWGHPIWGRAEGAGMEKRRLRGTAQCVSERRVSRGWGQALPSEKILQN